MTQGIQGVLGLALGALLPASALAQELAFEAEAGRLAVSPSGIAGIERTQDAVLILLQPEVARAFADLTGQAVGQPMAVTLCGRTLTQPVVRDRIDSGRMAWPTAPASMTSDRTGDAHHG